jgi:hypothetical protein
MKIEFPDNVVCAFKWMKKNGREKELLWHDDNLIHVPSIIRIEFVSFSDQFWDRGFEQVYKELLE